MKAALVDCGGANIASLRGALNRLGCEAILTADAEAIARADRVFLPGVGAAGVAMQRLRQHGLDRVLPTLRQPVLGICLGMQLMFEHSEEDRADCLGLFAGSVRRLSNGAGPVPHMGWNSLRPRGDSMLFAGVAPGSYVYFVHSYAADPTPETSAVTAYGRPFAAACQNGNFFGTQFHPERSAAVGACILRNFLEQAA